MVKKLNAVIGIICILCLIGHFVTMGYSMATGWYDYAICKNLAWATAITVSIHVVLIIIIFFFLHDGSSLFKQKRMNVRVIVQRISAIIMIILLHFHVKDYGFIMSGDPFVVSERIRIIIMEAIFFLSVFSHIGTSFSPALLSLGVITRESTYKRVSRVVGIICLLSFIILMIIMVRFVSSFVGKG